MKFRTEYIPKKSDLSLDPTVPVVLIGSCFADNMARKMRECQWDVFNDAGTLYNPLSIARVLDLLLFDDDWESHFSESLFESEGYVHSWLFDSHFSRMTAEECMALIKEMRSEMRSVLEKAQVLIVTFGTSWCYFLEENPCYVVANCHKMPQSLFVRRRVSVDKIAEVWTKLHASLSERYPDLKIVFTVSPVRHLKDGFEGNARSKATLILAVEEICDRVGAALYFPAYEIVTDDLRDYRFYASDLVHPSDQAVDYLWEVFVRTFIDSRGEEILRKGNRAFRRLNHRQIKK